MTCPKCGYEVRDSAKFCGHCGTPLHKQPVVSSTQAKASRLRKQAIFVVASCVVVFLAVSCMTIRTVSNAATAKQELMAYLDVLPPVSSTAELQEITNYTAPNVTKVYRTSNGDYAIQAEVSGFDSGILTVILGIDSTGHEYGISVDASSQTNGIGSHVADLDYLAQFSGMDASVEVVLNENYDGYSGATISSTALFDAINDCLRCYRSLTN